MMARRPFSALGRDDAGSTIIEFALLAPLLLGLSLGIIMLGVQMQNYSAMRSLASDMNRYTVVEYQKSNALSDSQIRDVAAALAIHAPYGLKGDRLDVAVVEEVSPIAGAKKFSMNLTYAPFNFLSFYGVTAPTLNYEQNIYVPASSS